MTRVSLPLLRSLAKAADTAAAAAVARAEAAGSPVSCRKGCTACCHQVVPVAPAEAARLAHLVEELPEPQLSEVRGRFAAALDRLDRANVLDRLRGHALLPPDESERMALDYFAAGVACPFLAGDGSCSIYADRPLSCRTYLVTSPAEQCDAPGPDGIKRVAVPDFWRMIVSGGHIGGAVPLVLALEHESRVTKLASHGGAA